MTELCEKFRHLEGGSIDLKKDEVSGIATVVMNNPARKNAFTGKMMVDFYKCVSELEKWDLGKCVILMGARGTFCSGGDLETVQKKISEGREMSQLMQNATYRLFNLPMVSVAAIDGHALGGGAELATSCDFRIMKSEAKIGFVQVRLNIATGWGGCTRLVHLCGRTKALGILTSGKVMNAEIARNAGLVDDVLTEDVDIRELARRWITERCPGDVSATRTLKQMVLAAGRLSESESYTQERELFSKVWGSESHLNALNMNKKHK